MGQGEEKDVRHMRIYSMFNPTIHFTLFCLYLSLYSEKKDKKTKEKKLLYFLTVKKQSNDTILLSVELCVDDR